MFDSIRSRRRRRELASDTRAGIWARNQVQREQWEFIRREWKMFTAPIAVTAALLAVVAYFTPNAFVRGLVIGGVSVALIAMLWVMVMLITGTAYRGMGATAETWTASELRQLRRAGWRVVNHFSLKSWDIDHVLVGPGGIVAVETKWSATNWQVEPPEQRVQQAAQRARDNARSLRLWEPIKRLGITEVDSAVFLWGYQPDKQQRQDSRPIRLDETTVIRGTRATKHWRGELTTRPQAIPTAMVEQIWQALNEWATVRDETDAETGTPFQTVTSIYWQTIGTLFASLASVYAFAAAISLTLWLATPTIVALLAVGLAARRLRATKIIALGWLTPLACGLVLLAVLLAVH